LRPGSSLEIPSVVRRSFQATTNRPPTSPTLFPELHIIPETECSTIASKWSCCGCSGCGGDNDDNYADVGDDDDDEEEEEEEDDDY